MKNLLNTTICIILVFNFLTSFGKENSDSSKLEESSIETCNPGDYYWLVYDNVCPYCSNATKYIKQLDWEGRYKFISYRNPQTYKMFPFLNREECEKDPHLVTPGGKVLKGYEVFRHIIDNVTATKILNPILKNNFAEQKLKEIYERMVYERSCYYKDKEGTPSCGAENIDTKKSQ